MRFIFCIFSLSLGPKVTQQPIIFQGKTNVEAVASSPPRVSPLFLVMNEIDVKDLKICSISYHLKKTTVHFPSNAT